MTQYTEAQVRILRDFVYDGQTTDNNWESCKEGWMKPENVRWLEEQTAKVKEKLSCR